jgi:hypothetical protein
VLAVEAAVVRALNFFNLRFVGASRSGSSSAAASESTKSLRLRIPPSTGKRPSGGLAANTIAKSRCSASTSEPTLGSKVCKTKLAARKSHLKQAPGSKASKTKPSASKSQLKQAPPGGKVSSKNPPTPHTHRRGTNMSYLKAKVRTWNSDVASRLGSKIVSDLPPPVVTTWYTSSRPRKMNRRKRICRRCGLHASNVVPRTEATSNRQRPKSAMLYRRKVVRPFASTRRERRIRLIHGVRRWVFGFQPTEEGATQCAPPTVACGKRGANLGRNARKPIILVGSEHRMWRVH